MYVDDLLIFGTNYDSIKEAKDFLSSNFDMKDMGIADIILGIKIIRKNNYLYLSQSHYIEKILHKFNHHNCKPMGTPFDSNIDLYPHTGTSFNQLE